MVKLAVWDRVLEVRFLSSRRFAGVAQRLEAADLNPAKCEFDSHLRYDIARGQGPRRTPNPPMLSSNLRRVAIFADVPSG